MAESVDGALETCRFSFGRLAVVHQGAQESVGDDVGKKFAPDHRRAERFET